MKKTILLLILTVNTLFAQTDTVVEVFLPNVMNQFPNVRDISISNEQNEIYFTVESYKKEFSFIAVIKKKNGNWSKPKVASFSGLYKDLEPFLSPDNLKLFFASNRGIDIDKPKNDMDIWYVERELTTLEWSAPINAGKIINTDKDEFYPSVTNSGNLYFTAAYADDTKGKEDIYVSEFVDGSYTKPISLSDAVNSETYEFNAYVSPNEDTIIFSSYRRPDSVGGTDLYVSHKDENGNWQPAKNLGDQINSDKIDYCPFIDYKTNTFYFTSERSHQKKEYNQQKNINEILSDMNATPNGLSRIYKTNISVILNE